MDLPFENQRHSALSFLGGQFKNAAERWSIIEKEAFAIVECCTRLEYLLLREQGFRLFADHRNLLFLFDPAYRPSEMKKYKEDKLERWALRLHAFPFTLEHITGEKNVWADMLSRWAAPRKNQHLENKCLRVQRVRDNTFVRPFTGVRPLQAEEFQWPDMFEIKQIQQKVLTENKFKPNSIVENTKRLNTQLDRNDGLIKLKGTKIIWIPLEAKNLQTRLMVIAHAGSAGHRGEEKMTLLYKIRGWPSQRCTKRAITQSNRRKPPKDPIFSYFCRAVAKKLPKLYKVYVCTQQAGTIHVNVKLVSKEQNTAIAVSVEHWEHTCICT